MDLVLILFEGLVQNILLELRDRIQNERPTLQDYNSGPFYSDIKLLSGVAGIISTSNASTVVELLAEITVGTALTKQIRGRPNPKDLGLLRNKIYRQLATVIKQIMKLSAVININEPNEQKD